MKFVSFLEDDIAYAGLYFNGMIFKLQDLHPDLPANMNLFLAGWDKFYPVAAAGYDALSQNSNQKYIGIGLDKIRLLAPIPHPASCRDGYAFRQHVAAARRNRNLPMIAAFDEYPIFYFTNHQSVQGPGAIQCMPDHFEKLDFELEVAIVICKQGRNIPAEKADEYIGGLMIMNDMSARTLQMEEMLLNLGPAKGKDFSTVIGPWLVTLPELQQFEVKAKEGHVGKSWNLKMKCTVNGIVVSAGNVAEMDWTFAEIIERVSYGATIFPGDVIGSGTVGTGCFLELNGTGKLNDPAYKEQWLLPGDKVSMEIDGLGQLNNTIVPEGVSFSILAKKKNLLHNA